MEEFLKANRARGELCWAAGRLKHALTRGDNLPALSSGLSFGWKVSRMASQSIRRGVYSNQKEYVMGHLDVPEILIALGIVSWLGLAMYNWRHHHHHHSHR